MRNNNIIASILLFLAEYCLRGQKAWAWRVTAEWLKTPCLVLSRDYLIKDGLFPEDCGMVYIIGTHHQPSLITKTYMNYFGLRMKPKGMRTIGVKDHYVQLAAKLALGFIKIIV